MFQLILLAEWNNCTCWICPDKTPKCYWIRGWTADSGMYCSLLTFLICLTSWLIFFLWWNAINRLNTLGETQQMEEWGFQGKCYNLQQQQLLRHWVRNRASPWAQGMAKQPATRLDSPYPPRHGPTVQSPSTVYLPWLLWTTICHLLTNILQALVAVLSFSVDFSNDISLVVIGFWVVK